MRRSIVGDYRDVILCSGSEFHLLAIFAHGLSVIVFTLLFVLRGLTPAFCLQPDECLGGIFKMHIARPCLCSCVYIPVCMYMNACSRETLIQTIVECQKLFGQIMYNRVLPPVDDVLLYSWNYRYLEIVQHKLVGYHHRFAKSAETKLAENAVCQDPITCRICLPELRGPFVCKCVIMFGTIPKQVHI